MRLGIFTPTQNNGWVASKTSPQFTPDWTFHKLVAIKAEEYGFNFLLAPVVYHGYGGGDTDFWEYTHEPLSLMAGLAAITERVQLIPSIGILNQPPAVAAKLLTTISHVAGGRTGVNIVSGWEKDQYVRIGTWPGDDHFQHRYDRATEYIQVMRELWENGESSFQGSYYQLDGAQLGPQPVGKIDVVVAGQSDRGIRAGVEVADYQFITNPGTAVAGMDEIREQVARVRKQMIESGREVGVFPLYRIVLRDSNQEALDTLQNWRDNQDVEALAKMLGVETGPATEDPNSRANAVKVAGGEDGLFLSIGTIAGDAGFVAEQLNEIAAMEGVSGAMLSFTDYSVDIDQFASKVMPRLH